MDQLTARPVLIASGDPYQVRVMKDCLTEAGYQVQACVNGPAAIQALRSGEYSLGIISYDLPGRNAIQVLHEIRTSTKDAHLPVILFGPGMGSDERMSGFDAGADMCLEEDLLPRVFLARVKALLRRAEP